MNGEISVLDIFRLFLRKWWIFVIAIIIAAFVAIGFTKFFVQPVYVSSGTVYIASTAESNVTTLSDLMLSQELTYTYAEVLSSNTYLKSVAKKSGLNYTHKQLKSMIQIEPIEGASVMQVKVAAYDPKEACIIAETVLNGAQEEVARIIKGGIIEVIDHAEVPTIPSSPSYPKNVMLAAIFVVLVIGAVLFCQDYFDDRIKSRDDLDDFELPVLAEIPFVMLDAEKKKIIGKKNKLGTV